MAVAQATQVGRRRVVYGANVIFQIVLFVAAVVAVIYLAQRYKAQTDVTRSRLNSLTPRTQALLRKLPEDVTITALYTVLSEYDKPSQARQDRVRDLLRLYESTAGGRVTADLVDPMKDRGRLVAISQRLRDKPAYQTEAQEHRKALEDFQALSERLRAAFEKLVQEGTQLAPPEGGAGGPAAAASEVTQSLQRLLKNADAVRENVQALVTGDIPHYGQAVEELRRHLESIANFLNAIGDYVKKQAATGDTPQIEFLRRANTELEPLLKDVNALVERTRDLKRVELEAISDQLNRWASAAPILVETKEKAQVVSFDEVWPFRQEPGGNADADGREFAGEQAVSSAILKLTQKEKTAVVFTRWGGPSPIMPDYSQLDMRNLRNMPRAPFGTLNDLLGKENFITHDWDVKTQKEVPKIENAARTIYVVFPPEPPEQRDPRQPPPPDAEISPQDVQLITDAVNRSGMAIFLTGWQPPQMPIPGAPGGEYAFADYLTKTWGIEVRPKYLVLPFAPSQDDPGKFVPIRQTQRAIIDTEFAEFTNHAIAKPVQTLPGAMDAACPLEPLPKGKAPAGVTVQPLVIVKPSSDVWALEDIMRLNEDFRTARGTYRRDGDLVPPFPLGLAAERSSPATAPAGSGTAGSGGAAGTAQRAVVFGSRTFVANPMLEMPGGIFLSGGGFQAVPAYPANSDLFINALHWLTNDADRISMGAQRGEIPRLELKDDAWLKFWRVFLVGIWPACALVVGGGVWLFRRH